MINPKLMLAFVAMVLSFQISLAQEKEKQIAQLMDEVNKHLEKRDCESAIVALDKILTYDGDHFKTLLIKGTCLQNLNKYQEASDLFHQLLLKDSSNFEIYQHLVTCYSGLHMHDKGIEYSRIGLAYASTNKEKEFMLWGIGTLHMEKMDYDSAKFYYDKVLEINPRNRVVILNNSYILIELEKYKLAEKLILKVIEDDDIPNTYNDFSNLGYVYVKLGEYKKAKKYLDISKKMNPENNWIYRNYGILYKALGKKSKACKYYQKALDMGFVSHWGERYIKELADYCNQ
ncbi:hypothetical protein K6119_14080 [Paracrocinitomix mangrovi]|uniref:tetratricopeptide repeat protein n=1 Tax=Paracrocinitomix mangrovi TaxID=2862509 RepID=UPI001C8EBA47|nr:hypothetical protein [Paracrocinitomix mangrovi]UKN00859.1 hypothetical protein K6119_14080 [Paracrocinitomix mangrovi]